MKTCNKCRIEKEIAEFGFINKKLNRIRGTCKKCVAEYHTVYLKEHYKKNKQYYLDRAREKQKRHSIAVKNFKKTLSCCVCKESESCCLDFHHLDPSQKDIAISMAFNRGWSFPRLKTELDKCAVLCSNCHRKVHAGIINIELKRSNFDNVKF